QIIARSMRTISFSSHGGPISDLPDCQPANASLNANTLPARFGILQGGVLTLRQRSQQRERGPGGTHVAAERGSLIRPRSDKPGSVRLLILDQVAPGFRDGRVLSR